MDGYITNRQNYLQFTIYSFRCKLEEEKPESLSSYCHQFRQKLKLIRGLYNNIQQHIWKTACAVLHRNDSTNEEKVPLMFTSGLTWYQQNFQDVLSSNLTIGDLSKYLFNPIILYAVHHSARSLSTWHQRQEGVLSCLIYISGTQPISLNF